MFFSHTIIASELVNSDIRCTWWLQTLDSLGTKLSRASCTSGSVGMSSSRFRTRSVILEVKKKPKPITPP